MSLDMNGVRVLVAFADGGGRAPTGVRIIGPDGQWAQWGDMSPVERVEFAPWPTAARPALSSPQRRALARVARAIDEGHPPVFNPSESVGTRDLSVDIRGQLESLGLIERFDYGATVKHAAPPFIYFRLTAAGREVLA